MVSREDEWANLVRSKVTWFLDIDISLLFCTRQSDFGAEHERLLSEASIDSAL